jgi:ELWxxDGT repeat protein
MTRATLTALLVLILSSPLAALEGPAFMVKDLFTLQVGAPTELTSFAGRLYFAVSDAHAGPGLWRTDGTAAGTQLVQAGAVSNLTAAQGHLFHHPLKSGIEVWTVDAAGTASRLIDGPPASGLTYLTAVGSRAFFVIEIIRTPTFRAVAQRRTVAGTTLKQFTAVVALAAVGDTLFLRRQ